MPEPDSVEATNRSATRRARVLIVGGHPDERPLIAQALRDRFDTTQVGRLDEARLAMAQRRFDLLAIAERLPDGQGLDLCRDVQKQLPGTRTLMIDVNGSFEVASEAVRAGAIDVVGAGTALPVVIDRISDAVKRSANDARREQRVRRLQRICHDLDHTRQEISEQVDAMCTDLVRAYEDMTTQINDVAMASEFRTLLRMELDVEDLLRTTLEYLLTKTGPTNAAVFLPDAVGRFGLGAYVNYDCPRESIDELLTHLCDAVCPQMATDPDLVAFDDAAEFSQWIGMEDSVLANSQVIAFSCLNDGECLAVVVLFRGHVSPFEPTIAGTLDTLRTIFAEQLRQVIRVHHRAEPSWPDSSDDEFDDYDDYDFPMAA